MLVILWYCLLGLGLGAFIGLLRKSNRKIVVLTCLCLALVAYVAIPVSLRIYRSLRVQDNEMSRLPNPRNLPFPQETNEGSFHYSIILYGEGHASALHTDAHIHIKRVQEGHAEKTNQGQLKKNILDSLRAANFEILDQTNTDIHAIRTDPLTVSQNALFGNTTLDVKPPWMWRKLSAGTDEVLCKPDFQADTPRNMVSVVSGTAITTSPQPDGRELVKWEPLSVDDPRAKIVTLELRPRFLTTPVGIALSRPGIIERLLTTLLSLVFGEKTIGYIFRRLKGLRGKKPHPELQAARAGD